MSVKAEKAAERDDEEEVVRGPLEMLPHIPSYRLHVAQQSLTDLKALLLQEQRAAVATTPSFVGQPIRQRWYRTCVALAQLSDAAIALTGPSLVTASTTTSAGAAGSGEQEEGQADHLVPSPCQIRPVEQRLKCLRRLAAMRQACLRWLQPVRNCSTHEEISEMLCAAPQAFGAISSYSTTTSSTSSSSTTQEAALLQRLLKEADQLCDVDSTSWGKASRPLPLRIVDGLYVNRPQARRLLTDELLKEAELYGLPPFLRSVRRSTTPIATTPSSTTTSNACPLHLFPTPNSLDERLYDIPAASEPVAPLLQTEMAELAQKHCVFGMIVGDGDEIAQLLLQNSGSSLTTNVCMKVETADHDCSAVRDCNRSQDNAAIEEVEADDVAEGPGASASVRRREDCIEPYVRKAVSAAQQCGVGVGGGSGDDSAMVVVDWLWGNRWARTGTPSFYGLIYMAVVPSGATLAEFGSGCEKAAPYDVEVAGDQPALRYYVAGVVEVRRA